MTCELSYSSIKLAHQVREYEEKRLNERKKHLLYVVHHYLREEGYSASAQLFEKEAQLNNQFTVCDNVDLSVIYQEYESYYYLRFQKYPRVCKKSSPTSTDAQERKKLQAKNLMIESTTESHIVKMNADSTSTTPNKETQKANIGKQQVAGKVNGTTGKVNTVKLKQLSPEFELTILPLTTSVNPTISLPNNDSEFNAEKVIKPLGGYEGYSKEWKEFADIISKEIFQQDLNVKWEDIKGLETAKQCLKEAVIYPTKYPELFSGILTPWKGLLLYGPPGTGKTMLAKAVATECKTTFFNISASSIVSKWRGNSEKLVRVMFELAQYHAPSTIFLDELDALASKRDGSIEHEASRRLKTELLIQLDGLAQTQDRVFLLATSNLPWDLDPAMLRRLEKRILVDTPTSEARCAMLKHYLPPVIIDRPQLRCDLDYYLLAEKTEDYSGSDIKLVCKEAAMQPMRKVFSILENPKESKLIDLKLDTIRTEEVLTVLTRTKPSSSCLLPKYRQWQAEFGST